MKKLSGFFVTLVLLAAAIWLVFSDDDKSPPSKNSPASGVVTFQCKNGKSIEATFKEQSVELHLSDGRIMHLPQARSASGARYANKDESIVFWNNGNTAFLSEKGQKVYVDCLKKGTERAVPMQQYQSPAGSFSLQYPAAFDTVGAVASSSTEWSYSSAKQGTVGVKLRLPSSYQPKTNFREAVFLVGWSREHTAVQACLEPPEGNIMKTGEVNRNGIHYVYTRYGEAGAGNFYEVDRYRTLRNGACYSIEQMIHTTNLGNYSPDQDIQAFDEEQIRRLLQLAWQGFAFTK